MEKMRFSELNLSREMMKAVADMGFEETTPIQAAAIPPLLAGRDIIGQAQTGTGKTAAFGIPLLERLDPKGHALQAVVLCPTRELAVQVAEELQQLAKYLRGVAIVPVYGGQPIDRQLRALRAGVQVIIGTPGRLLDHLQRGTVRLDTVRTLVLDEADEMLDMGFRDELEAILAQLPATRQTVCFSATMARPVLALTRKYQRDPEHIRTAHKTMTVPEIEQVYFEVRPHTRTDILCRLLDANAFKLTLVFCNTKRRVDELLAALQARGYLADGLHGDMNQVQRDRVMQKFRSGRVEILVATDVAARGLDIDDIDAVCNFEIPQDEESYVHRIGRTARAGRAGKAFTFVIGREVHKLAAIQRFARTKIHFRRPPTPGDVAELKYTQVLDRVRATLAAGGLGPQVSRIERLLADDFTALDIAAALLKLQLGPETVTPAAPPATTGPLVRLFIDSGRNRNVQVRDLVGSIANEAHLTGAQIGKVRIFDHYSFVEVPADAVATVTAALQSTQLRGFPVTVTRGAPAGGRRPGGNRGRRLTGTRR